MRVIGWAPYAFRYLRKEQDMLTRTFAMFTAVTFTTGLVYLTQAFPV